ncbi:hypothetical protein ACFFLS_20030 [Flavobacterium procerum]|uniref:Uncharacterized protein n=1 Tax=Flavobacterium procerum TaxID=1455569 RepID=A0ABV6BV69_9FLAO
MRLEPRDSLFEDGNELFPELNNQKISQFIKCDDQDGTFLFVVFEIKDTKNKYQLFLDSGLAFANEHEYVADIEDLESFEIVFLNNQEINKILWFPDGCNSKIDINTKDFEIQINCKNPEIYDSESIITIKKKTECL